MSLQFCAEGKCTKYFTFNEGVNIVQIVYMFTLLQMMFDIMYTSLISILRTISKLGMNYCL